MLFALRVADSASLLLLLLLLRCVAQHLY